MSPRSRRWELSRRTFLRGAGAALALPLLEQMLPRNAQAADAVSASVRRLVVVFVPNGIYTPQWTPAQTAKGLELSPILSPLEDLKDEILVISGLANRPAYPDQEGPHVGGTGSVLTSRKILSDGKLGNGISLDQLAAAELGKTTRFRSLELGLEGSRGGTCGTFSCAYLNSISWASETLQMSKETSPQALFARLFGDGQPTDDAGEKRRRRSILDLVKGDAARLNARLGVRDRQRVDEYFTGIRELERRLDHTSSASCTPGAPPPPPADLQVQTRQMMDLITASLACDLTRVVTFMMGNGQSYQQFPFLGVTGEHHVLSHHQNNPELIAANVKIETWEVEQFASLVRSLKTTTDPLGGSLLDSTVVLFISEMGDPNEHDRLQMPVLLAGRAGGALHTGRHLQLATETPLANLHHAILNMLDVPVTRFGDDGTGPLTGL